MHNGNAEETNVCFIDARSSVTMNCANQIINHKAQASLISPAACYASFVNVFGLISDTLQTQHKKLHCSMLKNLKWGMITKVFFHSKTAKCHRNEYPAQTCILLRDCNPARNLGVGFRLVLPSSVSAA